MVYSESTFFLLSTSIDGTLGVYDLRKNGNYKLYALSDFIEDELHCLKIMENGKKVACGTSEGPLAIFNWDWFGDYKDRILGHPGTINCIEKLNEDFMFTGCEDGIIRIVSLYKKNIEKVIGETSTAKSIKENKEFSDIEVLSLDMGNINHNIYYKLDKSYLAVVSNLNYIKIFDINGLVLENEGENDDKNSSSSLQDSNESVTGSVYDEEELGENLESNSLEKLDNKSVESVVSVSVDSSELGKINKAKMTIAAEKKKNELIEEIDADGSFDEDEDSFSSSEDNRKKKNKKPDKSLKQLKVGTKKTCDWVIEKERRKEFFNDL